ncbi:MAG: MerR family transcriptional regulator [Desulfuromonadales bacterium]|jgi:DNA-binding transcriptional MerR regulator
MDSQIPDKLYYKIGEVAKFTGVKTHVLRYWESEFSAIKPNKSRSNQRLYRRQDVDLILRLKDLLYNQGFTIAGARKKLREKPAAQETPVPDAQPPIQAADDDQLALPLAGTVDLKILKEIQSDIVRLQKSLKDAP